MEMSLHYYDEERGKHIHMNNVDEIIRHEYYGFKRDYSVRIIRYRSVPATDTEGRAVQIWDADYNPCIAAPVNNITLPWNHACETVAEHVFSYLVAKKNFKLIGHNEDANLFVVHPDCTIPLGHNEKED